MKIRRYCRFSATSPCANRQFRRPGSAEGSQVALPNSSRWLLRVGPPAPTHPVRQFLRQHLGGWRVQLRASRKENFYATRECLFGMWQTRKCRERNVLMVRTTEEVVFRPPGGDVEGRAFRNRVSVQARGHRFIMNFVHASCATVWRTDVCARPAPPFTPGAWKRENPKSRKLLGKRRSLC